MKRRNENNYISKTIVSATIDRSGEKKYYYFSEE